MAAPFRKAILLFNPCSGRARERLAAIQQAVTHLRPLADSITVEPTHSAGSGGEQAYRAITAGCDLVIACGGDGTALDVLQGVVNSNAAFGVLPLGTANVLACDLELSQNLQRAARQLATYAPRRIPVGRISYSGGQSRYFSVAAGVGVHAELIYNSNARGKHTGFVDYYVSGFDLLFRHDFVPFDVEITRPDGTTYDDTVLELVGMRVRSFGKFLSRWRPGSSLTSPHLHLVLLRESSRLAMVKYVLGAIAGTVVEGRTSADVSFVPCLRVRCTPRSGSESSNRQIRCQADGEMLGLMPAEMEIVPDALTMLMPPV
jgi:diacylglycerol kinase family enzyme